jgi:HPt (histidine-containing phosphotransfer) domain-containing protein
MPGIPAIDVTSSCASAAAYSGRAFDVRALVRRCMDDRILAAQLFKKFTSRLASTVETIESSIAAGDSALAISTVHNLKGEAASLAATGVQNAASLLEQSLRRGQLEAAHEYVHQLLAAAEQCLSAQSDFLHQLGQPQGGASRP